MQAEKTYHYVGRYGIAFDINEFIIQPGQCCELPKLSLPSVHGAHYQTVTKIRELYDRMLPGTLPCLIRVAVSRPLSRHQADLLNENRSLMAAVVGGTVGKGAGGIALALGGPVAGGIATIAITSAVGGTIKGRLSTTHAGDVIISISAQVNGGIGPQTSSTTLLITRK